MTFGFFLSENSERYAESVVDQIAARILLLEKFPRMGRVLPEMGIDSIRELVVAKFRVIYFFNPQAGIQILTIRHSSRPLPDTLFPSN